MMSDNVVDLYTKDPIVSSDELIETSKGVYDEVMMVGWNKDGQMEIRLTSGMQDGGTILWLLENLKLRLLTGEFMQ
jgi:hypothetical protein